MPRLLPLAAALAWALVLAPISIPGSLADPGAQPPIPVVAPPPPPAPVPAAFAQRPDEASDDDALPPDGLLPQRPAVEADGAVVEAEPVEADVTVEVDEDEGVPVEVSPSEPEDGADRGADRGPERVERDGDGDYVPDLVDTCPAVANVGQEDADGDGVGDACPVTAGQDERGSGASDYDGDGVPDESDNCWRVANESQKDGDGDGLGNGCDEGSAPFADESSPSDEGDADRSTEEPSSDTDRDRGSDPTPTAEDDRGDGSAGDAADRLDNGAGRDREDGQREPDPEPDPDPEPEPEPEPRIAPVEQPADDDPGETNGGAPAAAGDPATGDRGERRGRDPDGSAASNEEPTDGRGEERRTQESDEFAVVARIDAGALGDATGKQERGSAGEDAPKSRDRQGGEAGSRPQRGDAPAATDERGRAGGNDGSETPPARVDAVGGQGPVPIEDGALIADATRPDLRDDPSSNTNPAGADGTRTSPEDVPPGLVRGTVLTQTEATTRANEPGDDEADDGERTGNTGGEPPRDERRDERGAAARGPRWSPDRDYRGGEATRLTDGQDVAGTAEDDIFLTQRAGTDGESGAGFIYAIPVDGDGVYRVRLSFAETWYGAPGGPKGRSGARVFDVDIEGETALRGFDIFEEAGAMEAVVETLDVEVDDGRLEIEFRADRGRPVVSAIEVLRPLAAGRDRSRDAAASERDAAADEGDDPSAG